MRSAGSKELPKPKNILNYDPSTCARWWCLTVLKSPRQSNGTTAVSAICNGPNNLSRNKKGPADTARAFYANQIACSLLKEIQRLF